MVAAIIGMTNLDASERAALAGARRPDGRLTILGYASLMDEVSARTTSPSASEFRLVTIPNYCRIFNLVSVINIERGLAAPPHLCTCTARRREGAAISGCAFSIAESDFEALAARETRLRLELVRTGDTEPALMWAESSHDHFVRQRCGDADAYDAAVGRFYAGELYREDALPVPSYVLRRLRAQRAAAPAALQNFLDASYLGDGATPLRSWLEAEVARKDAGTDRGGAARIARGGRYWRRQLMTLELCRLRVRRAREHGAS